MFSLQEEQFPAMGHKRGAPFDATGRIIYPRKRQTITCDKRNRNDWSVISITWACIVRHDLCENVIINLTNHLIPHKAHVDRGAVPGVKQIRMRRKTSPVMKIINVFVTADLTTHGQDDLKRSHQNI